MAREISGGNFPRHHALIEKVSQYQSPCQSEIPVQVLTHTTQTMPTAASGILVVDDEAPIRLALKEYLSTQGFEVTCAGEVEEAEALLTAHEYLVAIVDLRLAGNCGFEGLEILSTIRARYPQTRTVLLSANISPETAQMAAELGVDVLLHKPLPLSGVAAIICELMNRYPVRKES
jgi:DNA-binding response OmpR family regulator